MWIEKGFEILQNLLNGIISAIPVMVEMLPQVITTFANIINQNFPVILLKGAELLWQFIQGILSAIPLIIENLPQIIQAIVAVITAYNWLSLGSNIMQFFGNGIKGAVTFIKTKATEIVTTVKTEIGKLPQKLVEIGGQAVRGLWQGILNAKDWLIEQIGGFVSTIVGSFVSFFDIGSPSKRMKREVGKWLPPGIADGFEEAMPKAMDDMEKSFENSFDKFRTKINDMHAIASVSIADDGLVSYERRSPQDNVNYNENGNETQKGSEGSRIYNFYSPKPIDEIEAARQMKEAERDLAEGF